MTGMFGMPVMLFKRYYRKLWLRVLLYALLSLCVALVEPLLARIISLEVGNSVTVDGVITILTILASSMLAVSTFSLNVMVTAHRAAAETATPRVHRLLLDDTTTQSVLAVFIGAFVYALATIILIQAGFYGEKSAFGVMMVTVLVVVTVIGAMLRWIDHLSTLGSLDESIRKVHDLARDGLERLARAPAMGGRVLTPEAAQELPHQGLRTLPAPASGYLQLVDVAGLQAALADDVLAYVPLTPGQSVLEGQPLAFLSGTHEGMQIDTLATHFVIGDTRTYEQDPVFGLNVLSEIATRALSPGINDPGTAIDVLTRLEKLLWTYAAECQNAAPASVTVTAPRVHIMVPGASELFNGAFAATARDGAGLLEVAQHLQTVLERLANGPDPALNAAAQDCARIARAHAEKALALDAERDQLPRA